MTTAKHIATLAAYPIKDELGGGYRGVFFVHATKERKASDVLPTLEAARHWAKMRAHEAYDARGYRIAPMYSKDEYKANVWVSA